MQSVRTRVSSLLRRSSLVGDKSDRDASGSERESSLPPSPKGSLRKLSGEGKRRKRLSFSMRGRSGTAASDTLDHSSLAKKSSSTAVAVVEGADKPVVGLDLQPKADSPVETAEANNSAQVLDTKEENTPADKVVESVEVAVASVEVEQSPAKLQEVPPFVVQVTEHVEKTIPSDVTDADPNVKSGSIEVPFNVVMNDSPSHSMVNIAVEKPAPAPEPVAYDTSFTSTSSGAGPSSPPLKMPVPRSTGQPLSAIDELRAKGHPIADWTQKEDVNYDADEYVRVMTLFFLLPAVIFLGLPYLFSVPAVHELVSM